MYGSKLASSGSAGRRNVRSRRNRHRAARACSAVRLDLVGRTIRPYPADPAHHGLSELGRELPVSERTSQHPRDPGFAMVERFSGSTVKFNTQATVLWSILDTAGRGAFTRAHAAWLTYRGQECNARARAFVGGTAAPISFGRCEIELTTAHLERSRQRSPSTVKARSSQVASASARTRSPKRHSKQVNRDSSLASGMVRVASMPLATPRRGRVWTRGHDWGVAQ